MISLESSAHTKSFLICFSDSLVVCSGMGAVCMSLRSEKQKALFGHRHALSCPVLFHLSCDFFVCPYWSTLEHKGWYDLHSPGDGGKVASSLANQSCQRTFKTSLGGSGNFSKHSDSEEVLFKFKKKMMLFPWKIPVDYFQSIMLKGTILIPGLTP